MLTTSPTLADPSRSLFDHRGFSGNNGQGQLNIDLGDGGFSSLLDNLRDHRRGLRLSDAPASRFQPAQESSGEAQSLPDDEDDTDEAEASSTREQVAKDEIPVDDDAADQANDAGDANVQGYGSDEDADEPAHEEDGRDDEGSDSSDAGKATGQGASLNAGEEKATVIAPGKHKESPETDGDEEEGDERHVKRRASGNEGSNRTPKEKGDAVQRADQDRQRSAASGAQTLKRVDAADEIRSSAPTSHSRPSGADSGAKATDETSLPRHLQKAEESSPDQPREQNEPKREPIRIDRQHADRDQRLMPAASRVQQVESQVRLENATGQSGVSDISSRIAVTASGGSNGASLNGEQSGQHLPSQTLNSAERAMPDDVRFSGRVVRGLTAMINQRGGTMTMRLDPPDLGQMRVQMTLARGTVSASFFTQTNQARALLEKNMAALRVALENQGLTVERLNVQSSSPSSQQGHLMNDENQQRQQEQQRQDAAGEESRGKRDEANRERQEREQPVEFSDVIGHVTGTHEA